MIKMTSTIIDLLKKREQIKKKKPHFIRTDAGTVKRLQKKWKRPRGRDNKIRRRLKGRLASPSYSSPKKVKGRHPNGLIEILISNLNDLDNLDSTEHTIRIRGTIGNKKKRTIIKKAKKLKLHILNPGIKLKTKPVKEKKEKKKETETQKKPEKTKEQKTTPEQSEKQDKPAKKEQEQAKEKPEQPTKEKKEKPKKEKKQTTVKKTVKKDTKQTATKATPKPLKAKKTADKSSKNK
ncbi:MAG: 50S ribosomal protein L32e [Candidatus Nanohalarchaeota archaeon]|nr:MAG: 50S ribosomal protein L32e [Candidatus Nanohaloarchaeota archaeon]